MAQKLAVYGRGPCALHLVCLTLAGPGRHGDTDGGQRLVAERAKLEVGPTWNRETDLGINRDHFLVLVQLAPHLAPPTQEESDLLDGAMGDGKRCLAGCELKMGQTPAAQAKE